MSRLAVSLAAIATAMVFAGCGEEERPLPPEANTPRVALTLDWPGVAPWALITFVRQDGSRCAALGTLTKAGPRVLGALGLDLASGLATRGRCLDPKGSVLVDVDESPGREVQVVGGLAAEGVVRLRIAGQVVRPRENGAFLLITNGAQALGRTLVVERHGGRRETVALPPPQRTT